jgi:hypothetical protein
LPQAFPWLYNGEEEGFCFFVAVRIAISGLQKAASAEG